MDSLSQVILGAAVGDYYGGKRLKNKARIRGAILGTVPDLDVFLGPLLYTNPLQQELFHRSITHSLLFACIAAPVFGFLITALYKKNSDLPVKKARYTRTVIAFLCFITHSLLDLFTGYGTQLLRPFDRTRFAIDSIFIIDPLYTLPFIILFVRGLQYAASHHKRKFFSGAGLLLSTCYLGRSLIAQQRAVHTFQATVPQAQTTIHASPELATTFLRRGRREDDTHRYFGRRSLRSPSAPIERKSIEKNHTLLEKYATDPILRTLQQRRPDYSLEKNSTTIQYIPTQFGLPFGRIDAYQSKPFFVYTLTPTATDNLALLQSVSHDRIFPENAFSLRRQKVFGIVPSSNN